MTAPTRRERLRTAAVSEIKDGARRLLVTGGAQAISLRAIARDMGMTAPAIYRYFPSLDALIVDLAEDLLDELREHLEVAQDAAGESPIAQLTATARAFRNWSVRHPVEFGLVFGSLVPGVDAFPDNCSNEDDPGARLNAVFITPLLELWHRSPFPVPTAEHVDHRLAESLGPILEKHSELPIEVARLMLSGWTMLYGLVSMEVYHQLRWAVSDPEALFEAELAAFLRQLAPEPDADPPHPAGPDADRAHPAGTADRAHPAGSEAGQPRTDPGHPN